ncbi:MAG TPA: xanthine dehydrogenase family protein subunit M [Nocardioidaceae bacterium]|nr:xanthine dehydrogenase family protein subunit M [Nocardioidaceae bacterium]
MPVQTPAPVDYERATSVEHALQLLERLGPDSRLIAGGHSLLPMMRIRLAQPECVIDINDLTELDYIRVDGDDLCFGAMTRHAAVLASPVVGEHYPLFHDAERLIADPPVRNRGTVGGSFCQADPAEDLSAVGSALKATLVLRSPQRTRTVPAREFHQGPYMTALDDAEMLTEVRVPIRPGAASAYTKVKRRSGDWATAGAGAYVVLRDGVVADVGIGLTAVGAPHFCAEEAEAYLVGKPPTDEHIAEAGRLAARACNPRADQRGPVEYKLHLADELTQRVLRTAVERAEGRS